MCCIKSSPNPSPSRNRCGMKYSMLIICLSIAAWRLCITVNLLSALLQHLNWKMLKLAFKFAFVSSVAEVISVSLFFSIHKNKNQRKSDLLFVY